MPHCKYFALIFKSFKYNSINKTKLAPRDQIQYIFINASQLSYMILLFSSRKKGLISMCERMTFQPQIYLLLLSLSTQIVSLITSSFFYIHMLSPYFNRPFTSLLV